MNDQTVEYLCEQIRVELARIADALEKATKEEEEKNRSIKGFQAPDGGK